MDLTLTLPSAVYVIWVVTLLAVVIVIPMVIRLLHRTLGAALSIRGYLGEIEASGLVIVGNTASVAALDDTLAVAQNMLRSADGINRNSDILKKLLVQRAVRGGLV